MEARNGPSTLGQINLVLRGNGAVFEHMDMMVGRFSGPRRHHWLLYYLLIIICLTSLFLSISKLGRIGHSPSRVLRN